MSKVKAPIQKTIKREESGNEYVLQMPKNSIALEIMDATEGTSQKFKMGPSFPLMIEHMVIEPQGLTVDSFDDLKELVWLGGQCFRFLNNPHEKTDEDSAETN